MDEPRVNPVTALDPSSQQLTALTAVADVFSRLSSENAIAAVHDILQGRGVRRLTVAWLNPDVASPVVYRYHADRASTATEPLDAQTLALALGADQLCELPAVSVRRLDRPNMPAPPGRLAYTVVDPLRYANEIVGFCVAQAEKPLTAEDLELFRFACVLIGQDLKITRESVQGAHAARALNLLLETARALSSGLDLADLFAKFHTLVGRVMDASLFVAALLTPDGEHLEIEYSAEFGRRSVERIVLPLTTVAGDVLRSGSPVIIRRPEDWNTVRSVTLGEASEPASALGN